MGLVIDIQERLFNVIADPDSLQANAGKMAEGLRLFDIPLLFTQQYTNGLGKTIASLRCESYVEKSCFSCYGEGEFQSKLDSVRPHILIAGIESHICVQQSAFDLLEQGYIPVILADCVSSRKIYDKEIALRRMEKEGMVITTVESALFEICKSAKHAKFKELSRIVK